MSNANDKRLFWGCFIALIATAFGFITRFTLLSAWGTEFGLDPVQLGEIGGVGVWPFAISIILFSLVVDRIGYGTAMLFAFICHITYAIMVICAPLMLAGPGASPEEVVAGRRAGYWMLYFGSLIFGLGNGTVEAVINPVVATMFSREKTKWLNILHAGWPGGLVLAGLLIIGMGSIDWRYKVALIFIPVAIYGVMMATSHFPVNERVAAGSSYMTMLREFGILAAIIVVGLIVRQIGDVFGIHWGIQLAVGVALVALFGAYTQSFGRPMLFFLMLIMIPLATTEIGTDGWITSLMEPIMEKMGFNPAWVLVYTSFIMLVLRFFAGPIVHQFSPLGLLAISSVLAAAGLYFLSTAAGVAILLAATLYGFGKTFFWPTMLGVVSEQFPRGGALTLNAIGGVGMLAVGVLGFPFIGLLQVNAVSRELQNTQPQTTFEAITKPENSILGPYRALIPTAVAELPKEQREAIAATEQQAKQGALATMAIFPLIMLGCYLILIAYFKSRGGYKAEVLAGHTPHEKEHEFTGGIVGTADL